MIVALLRQCDLVASRGHVRPPTAARIRRSSLVENAASLVMIWRGTQIVSVKSYYRPYNSLQYISHDPRRNRAKPVDRRAAAFARFLARPRAVFFPDCFRSTRRGRAGASEWGRSHARRRPGRPFSTQQKWNVFCVLGIVRRHHVRGTKQPARTRDSYF